MDLTQLFSGYKTYAGAAGLAVAAYLHFRAGDVPGGVALASQALAAFGLRAAIAAKFPALGQILSQLPAPTQQPTQLPTQPPV